MLTILNFAAVLAVAGYAFYLFSQIVYSRYLFVRLGKKSAFEPNLKERINAVLAWDLAQLRVPHREASVDEALS